MNGTGPTRALSWLRAEPRRRDATDAVLTAVVGLALIAVGLVDITGVEAPAALEGRWWHAAPLLLSSLVLLGKRRRPGLTLALVVALTGADVALGGSIGGYVVLLDALYCFVRYTRPAFVRPTILTVGGLIAAVPIIAFVATGDVRLATALGIQVFALLGTPVWWGWSLRQESRLVELERRRADDERRLAELQHDQSVREERSRMAQDLHDALSSNLSTIAIHSSAAISARGATTDPDPSLAEIRSASVRALEDLREMIQLLQTGRDPITPAAHLADVDTLVDAARGTGLSVEVHGDASALPSLPSTVDQAAYRIVQESLANAAKHAPGSRVVIGIVLDDATLRLRVTSRPGDGAARASAPSPEGSGLGLRTMQARALTLGGEFDAGWRDDGERRAFVVEAALPVPAVLVA